MKTIFKVYGNELLLRLEDYNLLSDIDNCIESSTATGYIMEEFITSKLSMYTRSHRDNEVKIEKINRRSMASIDCSYDCFANYGGIFNMINLKVEKNSSLNNAIAAINILHRDYVIEKPDVVKSYMVLKIKYRFDISERDGQRKIFIDDIDAYFLEELHFDTYTYKHDNRNWSKNYNKNSGRLQVSERYRKQHFLRESEISYENTRSMIDDIFYN